MPDASSRLAELRLQRVRLRREQELARQHPAFLLDRVRMVDEKTGEEFRFFLTDPESGWFWQRGTLDELVEHQKVIVLKARQLGITWLCAAYQLWEALTRPGTRHLVFRQREDDAIDIIRRIWLMFESLPEHLRFGVSVIEPGRGARARNAIVLQHPGHPMPSSIIGSVATERAARGATLATALFDEAAFIEKFRGLWSGTVSTVGEKGKMFVVSTANGMSDPTTGDGNYYHRLWVTAKEKGIHQVFLGWQAHPGRDQEWYETSSETRNLDERERAQEYPSNPSDAFRLTNATFYDKDALEEYQKGKPDGGPHIARPVREIEFERKTATTARIVERRGALINIFREPVDEHQYAIGVDIAAGRGLDYSAAYVVDLANMELVAELYSNRIQSDQLAFQLHYLGNRYRKAWIAIDRTTGWGEAVVTALRDGKDGRPPYPRLYRQLVDSRPDMPTHKPFGIALGEQNRPKVVNQLGRAIRERALPWMTSRLHSECGMFVEWPTGTSPRAAQGANDDCVMACAIALELYRQKGHWPDRKPRRGSKRTYETAAEQDAA